MRRHAAGLLRIGLRQAIAMAQEELEQLADHGDRAFPALHQIRRRIHFREQEPLQQTAGLGGVRRESGQPVRKRPNVFHRLHPRCPHLPDGAFNQAGNQQIDQLAQALVEDLAAARARELGFHGVQQRAVLRNTIGHIAGGQHLGRESVIQIGGIVGRFVRQIDQLRLQRRAEARQVGVEFRLLSGPEVARMFDDSFAHFECQVQARKSRVALLELLDNPEGVDIVVERFPEPRHLPVEFLLAGVGERRMPDVMGERQRLGEILVELESRRGRPRDLRHLDRVGQTVAEMIGNPLGEDLGLGLQPAERARMHDPVAVALEFIAVGVQGFRITPAAALRHLKSQPGEHAGSETAPIAAAARRTTRAPPGSPPPACCGASPGSCALRPAAWESAHGPAPAAPGPSIQRSSGAPPDLPAPSCPGRCWKIWRRTRRSLSTFLPWSAFPSENSTSASDSLASEAYFSSLVAAACRKFFSASASLPWLACTTPRKYWEISASVVPGYWFFKSVKTLMVASSFTCWVGKELTLTLPGGGVPTGVCSTRIARPKAASRAACCRWR